MSPRRVGDLWYANEPLPPALPEETRDWAEALMTELDLEVDRLWRAAQELADPDDHSEWAVELAVDRDACDAAGRALLSLRRIGEVGA